MNKFIKYTYILGLLAVTTFTGCSDPDDELTSIDYATLFSPTEVEARVVNRTNMRLLWNAVKGAETYKIELAANGDLNFEGTLAHTADVTSSPYLIEKLEGDYTYSVRIQAIGKDIPSSKWVETTFKTDTEQIFNSIDVENDLEATQITLRWPAGEVADLITITPGDITYHITADDIAAGAATITGLTPETSYTAVMTNGSKIRGTMTFETPLDLDGATLVEEGDDLATIIAGATDGDAFALMPGTYKVGKLSITKSIAIKAARATDRPVLNALISLEAGVNLELKDLILDGTNAVDADKKADQAIQFNAADVSYGDITINGCEIKNYLKGLLYFNVKAIAESITINNCIMYGIECDGGDFFDCRKGTAKQIEFTKNTVYNLANARDFFRIDNDNASALSPAVPNLYINQNTFNGIANNSSRCILYIRWVGHSITFTNNIISNSPDGKLTRNAATIISSSSNNNYFNASTMAGADTGSKTTLDPGFANAGNGDFTLNNEDLSYNQIGDPRWW